MQKGAAMLRARLAFPFLVLNTLGCPADDPDVDPGTETSGESTTDDDGSDTAQESSGNTGSDSGSGEAGSGDASSGEPCAPIGQPGPCCTGISVDGVCSADFGDACEAGQCCFGESCEVTGLCPEAPRDCGLIGESCMEATCCEGLSCSD